MTASTAPSLHDAIADMLPRKASTGVPMGWSPAYLDGFSDARHAAAELALEADAEIAEQKQTLAHMAGHVADLSAMVDGQSAEIAELRAALNDLEVGANTVLACYTRNPGNFAAALQGLAEYAEEARAVLATPLEAKS